MDNRTIQEFLNGLIAVKVDDITQETSQAIVNAANPTLLGGGGVDGAIHRAGGNEILEECRKIRRNKYPEGLPVGEAVITIAGTLPSEYVIHTVGPVYGQENGNEANLLASCYFNSLYLADQYRLSTVSFPSISTGAFRYPKDEAAKTVSASLKSILEANPFFSRINLIFFAADDAEQFLEHQQF